MADQVTQQIKDRLDIVTVLSRYMTVKRAGSNFKANCPFHHEKSPSFMISPSRQTWHCFGCNLGGDIFSFLMRRENIEFKEALQMLADEAGVELPRYAGRKPDSGEKEVREQLLRINDFAARFYQAQLFGKLGAQALQYARGRGLTEAVMKQWQIGYAPQDFHVLEQALAQKGVRVDDLVRAGVSVKNERGQVYDRFRNRLTFPIFDYFGKVVGFSARALDKDEQAKYINSPETVLYNKSAVLFGLNFAKQSIREQDAAVVVEGQMDCISAHGAGFANTVATSGTALTETHVRLLQRLTHNFIFCFDADSAGQRAARRAGELALALGSSVKVIILPQGKDPDELIKTDAQAWAKAVADAVWFVDYYISKAQADFVPGSVEQKQYLADEVLPLVLLSGSQPLEQDHYRQRIAQEFGLTPRAVDEALRKAAKPKTVGRSPQSASEPEVVHVVAVDEPSGLEKEVLGGMLALPEFRDFVLAQGGVEVFGHEKTRNYAQALFQEGGALDPEDTLAQEAQFMVELALDDVGGNTAALLGSLQKTFFRLRLAVLKQRQQELGQQIKRAELARDAVQLNLLNTQFAELTQLRLHYEQNT